MRLPRACRFGISASGFVIAYLIVPFFMQRSICNCSILFIIDITKTPDTSSSRNVCHKHFRENGRVKAGPHSLPQTWAFQNQFQVSLYVFYILARRSVCWIRWIYSHAIIYYFQAVLYILKLDDLFTSQPSLFSFDRSHSFVSIVISFQLPGINSCSACWSILFLFQDHIYLCFLCQ